MTTNNSNQSGMILPAVLGFIVVIAILAGSAFAVIENNLVTVNNNVKRQQAFNIAEAGINYYLWHLSHSPNDYKDGQTTNITPDPTLGYGPFVHDYIDDNAINQGSYTLYIKPQSSGSTVTRVRSIGKVNGTNIVRTIDADIGAPSFASYSVVSDSALWFGNTETATGPVHSNQGVRMDGASNADVTSANTTYTPSNSLGGDGLSHPGVWCKQTVLAPVNCNNRPKNDWRYPVPSVDFNSVSGNLCTMKKTAFANDPATSALANNSNACSQVPSTRTAAYLPQTSTTGFSISRGYLIQLNSNGTYDLQRVTSEIDTRSSYSNALSTTNVATGIAIPSSGVIFSEDNVWVRSNPTFSGRVTIAAGRLATNSNANIVIADDVVYSTKNGNDALGLVAEGDIIIAPYAPPASGSFTFEIDAAMIAQSGNIQYPATYRLSSNRCTRGWVNNNQQFSFYGSVATRQQWTWTWQLGGACGDAVYDASNGYISGIEHNNTQYDYNLLYAPPPSFPITSSYAILSWREVLTKP